MKRSNIPLGALSLVTSVLIWANVYTNKNRRPDPTTMLATLSASGLDESKFAVTAIPESVSLTLAGTNDQLRAVTQQAPSAYVYLANVEAGTRSLPIVVFPPMVRDLMVNNLQTARVTIEPLVTKPVGVRITKVGSLPSGVVEESNEPFPRRVFVRGTSEAIKRVVSVSATVSLSDAFTLGGEIEVEGKAMDAKGVVVDKVLLLVSDDETKYNATTLASAFMILVKIKTGPAPTIP